MDPFMLRTQLERNNADLEQYSKEIAEWSKEMTEKEGGRKEKKPKVHKKQVNVNEEQKEEAKTSQKVQRLEENYSAWDKYDADKECEKVDNEKTISAADYDDLSDETDEENIDSSMAEKDKGNNFFKANDFESAIKCYNRAIELYDCDPVYFANRAMCYLKLENYEKAESDCSLSLVLDKKYVKAYQRRAIAREHLNKLVEAKEDLLKVFDFEPSNKESKAVLKRIENKIAKTAKPVQTKKHPEIEKSKIQSKLLTKSQPKDEYEFSRPKSKFALSRQQNKDIKTTYSPSALIEPISDKIIERRIDSDITNKISAPIANLDEIQPSKLIHDYQEMLFKWPKHDDEIKEYNAIKKSPKARSQSVLKKIAVSEDNTNKISTEPKRIELANIASQNTKKSTEILEKGVKYETGIKDITTNPTELDEIIFKEIPKDDFSKLNNRPVPKTSLQFYYNWKELDVDLKYLFLLKINPREFVNIFKNSLESDYFSSILKVLAEGFIPRKKSVVPYLYGLSKVKRFSTLTMFKTAEDTSVLKTLMDYVEKDEVLSKFTALLKKRYESV